MNMQYYQEFDSLSFFCSKKDEYFAETDLCSLPRYFTSRSLNQEITHIDNDPEPKRGQDDGGLTLGEHPLV
jgi:hypothetical protein